MSSQVTPTQALEILGTDNDEIVPDTEILMSDASVVSEESAMQTNAKSTIK